MLTLQPVFKNGKTVSCAFTTQTMFDEWFFTLTCNINNERIYYFLTKIKQ